MVIFLMCLKIFFCRIFDVSLGTLRTVLIVRNKTWLSVLVGFVEVFIWFLIVKDAINTGINSIWIAVAYAGGFAAGTYIGCLLAKKVIVSKVCVQIITTNRDQKLLEKIRSAGYPMTVIESFGQLKETEKYLILIEVSSNQIKDLRKLVISYDEKAFIMVQESKDVYNGFFFSAK